MNSRDWYYLEIQRHRDNRMTEEYENEPYCDDRDEMSKIAVDTLVSRIENVIQIHRDAEDITIGEIIGALEIIKLDIFQETVNDE